MIDFDRNWQEHGVGTKQRTTNSPSGYSLKGHDAPTEILDSPHPFEDERTRMLKEVLQADSEAEILGSLGYTSVLQLGTTKYGQFPTTQHMFLFNPEILYSVHLESVLLPLICPNTLSTYFKGIFIS